MSTDKKRRVTFLLAFCIVGAFWLAYTSTAATIGEPGTALALFFQALIVALWGIIVGLEIAADD